MVNINQTFRHCRRIFVAGPTRAEENPCVIIRHFIVKEPVLHNQETNASARNYQVRHIGCIYSLPDATLEWTDPRVLRSNVLTPTETNKGLQNAVPNNKTSKSYTSKANPSPLQVVKHTYEHSHQTADLRHIFLLRAVLQLLNNYKREDKRTRILQKGDIHFYIKRCKFSHDSGIPHLANKVSLTFCTQKNSVKNSTVTQWRTTTTLCLVRN